MSTNEITLNAVQRSEWLNHLPVAACVLSQEAQILDGNPMFWLLVTGHAHAGSADALTSHADSQTVSVLRRHLAGHSQSNSRFELELSLSFAEQQRCLQCCGVAMPAQGQARDYVCVLHDVTAEREALANAKTQVTQLRLLADNVPAATAYYKAEGFKCLFANRLYARMFGHTEDSILGKTFSEVIGEEGTRTIQPMVDKLLNEGIAANYVRLAQLPGGHKRWLDVNLVPQFGELGQVIAVFVMIADITKQREAEQALRESEQRLSVFTNASAEGIAIHHNNIVLDVNPALCELLGYTAGELIGDSTLKFVPPEYRAEIVANLEAERNARYESALISRSGVKIPVEYIGRTLEFRGVQARMSIVRDLRDRKAAEARITYLAHHDEMTGLINRAHFMSLLSVALEGCRRHGKLAALLFIDLDDFKQINDTQGHRAGDEMLKEVAKRLTANIKSTDIVARFAGDEFIVLMQQLADVDQIKPQVLRIMKAISAPLRYAETELKVTASIGIAIYPNDSLDADELISQSDSAAYSAKHAGRAQCVFYSSSLGLNL